MKESYTYLLDLLARQGSDELRFPHGARMPEPELAVAVAPPPPHFTPGSQGEGVLRPDGYTLNELTSERHHLLRAVVPAHTPLGLPNQTVCGQTVHIHTDTSIILVSRNISTLGVAS